MFEINSEFIFQSVFTFIWLEFSWEMYLSYRQVGNGSKPQFTRRTQPAISLLLTCLHCSPCNCLNVYFIFVLCLHFQHQVYKKSSKPPQELEEHFNNETFQKARLYGLDKSGYGIAHGLFNQIFSTVSQKYSLLNMFQLKLLIILNHFFQVLILLNGHAYFWNLSRSVLLASGLSADSEIIRSMVFTVILSTFSTLVDMPFTIYYTFWLEERHGFNKQVWTVDNYIKIIKNQ